MPNSRSGIASFRSRIGNSRLGFGNSGSRIANPESKIANPRSKIGDRKPKIGNPRSKIGDREPRITNPESPTRDIALVELQRLARFVHTRHRGPVKDPELKVVPECLSGLSEQEDAKTLRVRLDKPSMPKLVS